MKCLTDQEWAINKKNNAPQQYNAMQFHCITSSNILEYFNLAFCHLLIFGSIQPKFDFLHPGDAW